MKRWNHTLIATFLCLSTGCSLLPSKSSSVSSSLSSSLLRGNPEQIRERLLSHIPIGTPRTDAMRIALSLELEPSPPTLGLDEDTSLHFQKQGRQWWGGEQVSLIQVECPNGVVEDIFCEQIGVEWMP
jgi:hypothetical protein